MDHLYKGLDGSGHFRIVVATTRELAIEAIRVHGCYPSSALVLAKALTATALVSSLEKDCTGLTVKIRGDGPVGTVVCDVPSRGRLRAYVENPGVLLERKNEVIDQEALGDGEIEVVKSYPDQVEPSVSLSPLRDGSLAQAFAAYYALSVQTPTEVNLTAVLGGQDQVLHVAGGYLVQALPGTSEDELESMSAHCASLPPLSRLLHEGQSLLSIARAIAPGFTCLENVVLKHHCPCSREEFARGITSLGKKEIRAMIDEDHGAEVVCRYCLKKHVFSQEDLEQMEREATRP